MTNLSLLTPLKRNSNKCSQTTMSRTSSAKWKRDNLEICIYNMESDSKLNNECPGSNLTFAIKRTGSAPKETQHNLKNTSPKPKRGKVDLGNGDFGLLSEGDEGQIWWNLKKISMEEPTISRSANNTSKHFFGIGEELPNTDSSIFPLDDGKWKYGYCGVTQELEKRVTSMKEEIQAISEYIHWLKTMQGESYGGTDTSDKKSSLLTTSTDGSHSPTFLDYLTGTQCTCESTPDMCNSQVLSFTSQATNQLTNGTPTSMTPN